MFYPQNIRQRLTALMGCGVAAAWLAACPAWAQTEIDPLKLPVVIAAQKPVPWKTSAEQYEALKAAAKGGTKKTYATLPDWSGLWTRAWTAHSQHALAPLKPEYQGAYKKLLDDAKKGIEWDHLSYCLPAGFPRTNNEPFLREFIFKPDQVWLINEVGPEVRRIYTDGTAHPPADEAFALWEGHSIGFWNGDTLVAHTTLPKAFASGYSRNGPPQSEQLSTVEEWRQLNKDLIELRTTVYDPVYMSRPFVLINHISRVPAVPGLRIDQWVCAENNNVVKSDDGGSTMVVPGEAGYKDPTTFGREGPK